MTRDLSPNGARTPATAPLRLAVDHHRAGRLAEAEAAYRDILEAEPDILNHNVETVPRLYKRVRPQAVYERSLDVLRISKDQGLRTKSGIMVGLGETEEEVYELMDDFAANGVDVMTIGQYLQPTRMHLPVEELTVAHAL